MRIVVSDTSCKSKAKHARHPDSKSNRDTIATGIQATETLAALTMQSALHITTKVLPGNRVEGHQ